MQATRQLLDFIIAQKLDIEQYTSLEDVVNEKFYIQKDGKVATKELIGLIINWEKHPEIYNSLEVLINNNFWIRNK